MKYICPVLLVLVLSACKGGDNDPKLTGQFVGEPVVGLSYSCGSGAETLSGLTNDVGEFSYRAGQVCVFSVGNITLGNATSIPCNGKIVPQDIAHVVRSATGAPSVLAISQFLQSLNAGTSSGKLVISSASRFSLANAPTRLLASASGAISQTELQSSLSLAGKSMVTPADAKNYLDRQLASGAIDLSCSVITAGSAAVLNSIDETSSANNKPAG